MPENHCRSGCPSQGVHATYGQCARASGIRVAYCQSAKGNDATRQKKFDAENAYYSKALDDGLNPAGTSTAQIDAAYRASDATGVAYQN